MGNKQSIPAPELVYRAAKAGNYNELEELAKQVREVGADAIQRRQELLEWRDEKGRTALIVAAGKGHKACVELLLQHGANVQHQSISREGGGSALHVSVFRQCSKDIIDLLLRFGASPFVENAGGFTALDYAILRKNSALVRRLESFGYFADYLKLKTTAFMGFNKKWVTRWVAIVPRHPDPRLPPNQQMIRRVLMIFQDAQQFEPSTKMYLDGARAATHNVPESQEKECALRLHSTHPAPKGNISLGGDFRTGFEVYLRPSSRDVNILHRFVQMVNQPSARVYPTPPLQPPPQAPPAAHSRMPSGDHRSDAEIAAELSRALNGGAALVGTSTGNYPPIHAPGLDRRNTAPPDQDESKQESPQASAPSAPPLAPSAPPMHDVDPFISSAPTAATWGGPGDVAGAPAYDPNDFSGNRGELAEEDLCVICLSEKKEAGFVHGKSVHKCCCVACAKDVMEGGDKRCPICRQEIEHVIENFYS